jgi:hypothetical protein
MCLRSLLRYEVEERGHSRHSARSDRAFGMDENAPSLVRSASCPLTHVPPNLWSRNPAPPRVSWSWMNPKRYARCTAAEVSGWSVSTLPLRSIGVSVLASTGATIRTLPDPTLGAGSARRLSKLSMARHPSNGSEMLVSRSSAPSAGIRLSSSVVGFRNRKRAARQLSTGIVWGRWRSEGCSCRHDGSVAGHQLPPRMSAAGRFCCKSPRSGWCQRRNLHRRRDLPQCRHLSV